ncbi:MAG: hypothetical protein HKN47_21530 [Pirellulaceae bacterium]|nr:hypothetical protein [Pirellulaceae bacterium]
MSTSLQAPGAGLPRIERFVANRMLRLAAAAMKRSQLAKQMEQESAKIIALCDGLTADQGKQRVLIDRIVGIEDSSRDWSIYMTVDHLCIVNPAIEAIIESLAGGKPFDQVVRIEDVKPRVDAGPDSVDRFEQSVGQFQRTVQQIDSLATGKRHIHPWFGALNAKQWFTLASVHTEIHRKQIQKIRQQL